MLIKRSTILLFNTLNGGSKQTSRLIDQFKNGCLIRAAVLSRDLCKLTSDQDKTRENSKPNDKPSSKSAGDKASVGAAASLFPDPILKG